VTRKADDMKARVANQFGGVHTADKLERVRQYLLQYTTVMRNKGLRLAYIDPFAGSGSYHPIRLAKRNAGSEFFPMRVRPAFDGSARIALAVKPAFDKYIFVDKNAKSAAELRLLRKRYPSIIRRRIRVRTGEANKYLRSLCNKFHRKDWKDWRAVMFLDPYGMQVEWATIEAIAQTGAIDLFCLFPLGVAVNRLLPRNGRVTVAASALLDRTFGVHDWYDNFYKKRQRRHLLGKYTKTVKVAKLNEIGEYYLDRLRSVFPNVAQRPLRLHKGSISLYWLCFAAGDKCGARSRVKMAEAILSSPRFVREIKRHASP
jgi:three-Cys-motif partner protein